MTSSECSICLCSYKKPKLLSCLHVYCLECVKTIYQATGDRSMKSVKCPLCRQLTDVPKGGVDALLDYTVSNYEAAANIGREFCGFCCKDSIAEFRCIDCEDNLCFSCKGQHLRMKQTRGHVLDVLQEIKMDKNKIKFGELFCRFHENYELKYYCVRCNTVSCEKGRECNHKKHLVKPLQEVSNDKRSVIKGHIETTKEHFATVVKEVYDIMVENDYLKTYTERKTEAIDEVADMLKRSVDGAAEMLKISLNDTGETLKQNYKESLETRNNKSKAILSLIHSTSQIVDDASNKELVGFQEDLTNHLLAEQTKMRAKDPRLTYILRTDVKDAILNYIQNPTENNTLCQSLILNNVKRSFYVDGNQITAIACLNSGSIVVCQGNAKQLTVFGAQGQDTGSISIPLKVGNLVHIRDGTLIVTEYMGTRVVKYEMYTEAMEIKDLHAFVQSVSVTQDGACIILSCKLIKAKFSKNHKANNRILIVNLSLDVQMEINLNTGEDEIKHAFQKPNGDFVAVTNKTCFTLSKIGSLKSTFKFEGIILAVCADKRSNLIVIREEGGSTTLTLYEPKLKEKKDLNTFTESLGGNVKWCMAFDDQNDMWIGYSNCIQCIKYLNT